MEREHFVKEVASKMRSSMCDIFVGSGISAPSGIPTWSDFLEPYAQQLGLRLHDDDDLPMIAQYIVNSNTGNRNIVSQAVFNTFGRDYCINEYHMAISNFPIKTVWTTNYDNLLEKAFSDRNFRVITSESTLLHPHDNVNVEIVKLHGCAKQASKEVILTQADYDCFLNDKPKLSQRLREAIINRSIFFLGYSYHDPNIREIMTQAYQMMDRITNPHYILLNDLKQKENETNDEFKQRKIRFKLWISELNRIGILELIVPREDIAAVLRDIDREAHEKAIFVTGSHNPGDLQAKEYAQKIGRILAQMTDVTLNNGQSSGIGNEVLSSFMQFVIDRKQDINKRIRIYPNPYAISPAYADDPALIPNLKMARLPLVTNSKIVITFPGNIGTNAEVEVARTKQRLVFPVLWDKNHYESLPIRNLLADLENMALLKEYAPNYYKKLEMRSVPSEEETFVAMRKIINGKK